MKNIVIGIIIGIVASAIGYSLYEKYQTPKKEATEKTSGITVQGDIVKGKVVENSTYRHKGAAKTITINDNKVIINGKEVDMNKALTLIVEGDVGSVTANVTNKITISGKANSVETQSGDISIEGDVSGNASTISGDIYCKNIAGDASTISGNISK